VFIGYINGPLPTGTDSEGLVMTAEMGLRTGGLFSSWEPYSAMGFQNDPLPLPGAIFLVFSWLGVPTYDVCKLIMACSFWLAGALMYICAHRISKSVLGGACAAIVFAFNQVFLSQIMEGHYFFAIGYALLPAIFLLMYLSVVEGNERATVLLPAAFLVYGGSVAPHMVLILAMFVMVFTGLYFALDRRALHRLAYPVIGLIILVLPSALARFSYGTSIYNASYRLSETHIWSNTGLVNALAARSTENSHLRGAAVQGWFPVEGLGYAMEILALLIPLLAFISLYYKSDRSLKIALAGTALVMLFFAMGPNQWLSGLFVWMFRNLPLLDSIRVFSRFGMFLGLIYAILMAMLIADLKGRSVAFRIPRCLKMSIGRADKAVAIASMAVMLTASSTMFVQGPSSFSLPASYSEPFEAISAIEGDYRILTLPYGTVYYEAWYPRLDGYPATLTDDPGTYSQYYTGKELAYGDHAEEYWTVWGSAISGRTYGYRTLPSIFGDVSSVKYVVKQVHADATTAERFHNMDGMHVYQEFPKNSSILENVHYMDRVHTAGALVLTTGGRADMLTSLAVGAVNLRSEDLALLGQIDDEATRQSLWSAASRVIVHGGDLLALLAENGLWGPDQLIRVDKFADHTYDDSDMHWISSDMCILSGTALHPSAFTQGENELRVPFDVTGGTYDVYVRARAGPGSGNLTVAVEGNEPMHVDTDSPFPMERWSKVGTYGLDAPRASILLSNDGTGWSSVDDILVVEKGEVERKISELSSTLSAKSIALIYGPKDLAPSSYWEILEGKEGNGLFYSSSSPDPHIILNPTIPVGGNWTITLRQIEGMTSAGNPYIVIDGEEIDGIDTGNGTFAFKAMMAEGPRSIEVHTRSAYSLVLEGSHEVNYGASSDVHASYVRTSPWQYIVIVNASEPTFLKLSENFNPNWMVHGGDGKVFHYRSSSQINGFYISEAGNYTLTITFEWQERYQINQLTHLGATAGATIALALFVLRGRRKRATGAQQ